MKVLVTGSSGLVGSALVAALRSRGDEVIALVRQKELGPRSWDPERGRIDLDALDQLDGVVHLAGASIGGVRWTKHSKERIRASRVTGTRVLCEALASSSRPPSVLVSASAAGYYGDRGDEVLTENSPPGVGFRAAVCKEWEAATAPAKATGIRVVLLRSGIVLSLDGGLLPHLLLPSRVGVLFRMGKGEQFWSWISIDDEVRIILHALDHQNVVGPVNAASPDAVRHREFMDLLAAYARAKRVVSVPSWLVKLVAGAERVREVLLSSQRVMSRELEETGFSFAHPSLGPALKSLHLEDHRHRGGLVQPGS